MARKIANTEELMSHLWRCLEIEVVFESAAHWESHFTIRKNDFRKLFSELSKDSAEHKKMVESLISMIRTKAGTKDLPLRPRIFDFSKMTEVQILAELAGIEGLAKTIYTNIREAAEKSNLEELLHKDRVQEFKATLDRLIRDETIHENKVLAFSNDLRTRR
jgi:rubrerythrin